MKEIWKPCFDGHYKASSLGRIRRLKPWGRFMPRAGRRVEYPPLIGAELKPWTRPRDGRKYVSLIVNGKRLTRGVHQVVADAFLGPRPQGREVNHKDGDKTNNHASNLEYTTHAENCAHAGRHGLVNGPGLKGERNPRAVLSDDHVREIRQRHAAGDTQASLAIRFGVCKSTIWWVVSRRQWRHVR